MAVTLKKRDLEEIYLLLTGNHAKTTWNVSELNQGIIVALIMRKRNVAIHNRLRGNSPDMALPANTKREEQGQ